MSRLANSSVLPDARPRASRVIRTGVSVKRLATKSEVPSPSRFGFVARMSSAIDPDPIRATKASIVNCSGP